MYLPDTIQYKYVIADVDKFCKYVNTTPRLNVFFYLLENMDKQGRVNIPYAEIGRQLGIDYKTMYLMIKYFKKNGIINDKKGINKDIAFISLI